MTNKTLWLGRRDEIVSGLVVASQALTGSIRRRVHRMADYLAYSEDIDRILNQPVLLEIFLSLEQQPTANQKQIDTLVESVIAKTWSRTRSDKPWWTVLLYPLLVLLVCCFVLVGMGFLIVPTFERMFDEFGLTLPFPTLVVIALSHAILSVWFYIGIFAVLGCVGICVWIVSGNVIGWPRSSKTRLPPSFRSAVFRTTQGIWADWAWHLSLLLRSGYELAGSIEIASNASRCRWMQNGGQSWAAGLRDGVDPFKSVTHFRGTPCHLLSMAMQNDVPENVKQEMLGHIAEVYWDRDQSRWRWRLGWVSPVIVVLVGFIVWFFLISLFMPLIELITGLS